MGVGIIAMFIGGGWTVEMDHRSPQGTLLRSLYLHLKEDPRESIKLKVDPDRLHFFDPETEAAIR